MPRLVLASKNKGKILELRELLAGLPLEIVSLADFPAIPEVIENGGAFAENAVIKAKAIAEATGELTMADDSGLEVDALNGEPGIYSARYGQPGWSDRERYRFLLEKLQDVPLEKRTARFRCAVALYNPDLNRVEQTDGTVEGLIIDQPRGNYGFGYDPVFLIPELGKTMAELSPEEKNRFSHRARAVEKMIPFLKRCL
ncbi:MAG: XTP/dITP diphosphatase [Firmicutes bacterium]|nr:XTP/dITP diphosphatase [Bacillota bacterium]